MLAWNEYWPAVSAVLLSDGCAVALPAAIAPSATDPAASFPVVHWLPRKNVNTTLFAGAMLPVMFPTVALSCTAAFNASAVPSGITSCVVLLWIAVVIVSVTFPTENGSQSLVAPRYRASSAMLALNEYWPAVRLV